MIYLQVLGTQPMENTNLVTVQLYYKPDAWYLIFDNSSWKPISTRNKKLLLIIPTMTPIKCWFVLQIWKSMKFSILQKVGAFSWSTLKDLKNKSLSRLD